jgi:hypothetical protein
MSSYARELLKPTVNVRAEGTFIEDIQALGYSMVDRWTIPSLSNVIETHRNWVPDKLRLLLPVE